MKISMIWGWKRPRRHQATTQPTNSTNQPTNQQYTITSNNQGDAYVHADVVGAASCVVRNKGRPGAKDQGPISPIALHEAGAFAFFGFGVALGLGVCVSEGAECTTM